MCISMTVMLLLTVIMSDSNCYPINPQLHFKQHQSQTMTSNNVTDITYKTVKYILKNYLIPSKNVSKNIWKMHVYCQTLGQTKLFPKSNLESDYKIEGKRS